MAQKTVLGQQFVQAWRDGKPCVGEPYGVSEAGTPRAPAMGAMRLLKHGDEAGRTHCFTRRDQLIETGDRAIGFARKLRGRSGRRGLAPIPRVDLLFARIPIQQEGATTDP